jgi:hypothetical protein
MLKEDYREMLQVLGDEKVRFLLVDAYALAAHGYPRATMDIDIWGSGSGEVPRAKQKLRTQLICANSQAF